jgi:hypothetical protein
MRIKNTQIDQIYWSDIEKDNWNNCISNCSSILCATISEIQTIALHMSEIDIFENIDARKCDIRNRRSDADSENAWSTTATAKKPTAQLRRIHERM